MKIVLATPLYPPDVAEPAPYMKELARRLSKSHEVTVVAYGALLEEVPGVRIIPIHKGRPLPLRLFAFTRALLRATRHADLVYVANGASAELPLIALSFATRIPLYLALADHAAHGRARHRLGMRIIERLAMSRAHGIISALPPPKPEILPLEPEPTEALETYERAWKAHEAELDSLFSHAHA